MATDGETGRPRTVLVHEHVSGGGLAGSDLPESWAVEGSAMRRALAGDFAAVDGVRVVMTLDARLPDEPGPWSTARIGPGDSVDTLPHLATRADATVAVAPESDGVLKELARSIGRRTGARWLGCSPDAIDLTGDKASLARHLRHHGIEHPSSLRVRPRDGLPPGATYPAVLKPIDGAGAVDTLYVASADDPILSTFGPVVGLLQPFLRGEPRSATFLVGPDRARLVGVSQMDIERDGGRFVYKGGTILPESLPDDHPARRAVGCVPGLRGLVGVDYMAAPKTGRAVVLEINPRPTTSVVGLVRALGPGRLASAWLDTIGQGRPDADFPPPTLPIAFRADGTTLFGAETAATKEPRR